MDFHTKPDGDYKYILHIIDHFSKYSCTFPLRSKEASETARRMATWIGFFGPPKILQCDNGGEFRGATLALLQGWGIRVINGRPRHPETQGLVEKANSTFKRKLRAWMTDSGRSDWADSLPEISLSMNQQKHSTTGQTPYQIVFKQRMQSHRLSFADRVIAGIVDEDSQEEPIFEETGSNDVDSDINIDPELRQHDIYSTSLVEENILGYSTNQSFNCTSSGSLLEIAPIAEIQTISDVDSFASARSRDSRHGDEDFDQDIQSREMHTAVRASTARARKSMEARYNTTHNIDIFNIGEYVSLSIPTKYRSTFTPKRIFCKVIRKPQPQTHELQCRHGILEKCFPTAQLERIPIGVSILIGEMTERISLARAVNLMHRVDPNAVSRQSIHIDTFLLT